MKLLDYDNPEICFRCGGYNNITIIEISQGIPVECGLSCKSCGFDDYWAHGWSEQASLNRNKPKLVIVESPYTGDIDKNLQYLRECMRDCCLRGESPYASHGLLTQPGVLNDNDSDERELGITLGYEWWKVADKIVFYTDFGISDGMTRAISNASLIGKPTETRQLYK